MSKSSEIEEPGARRGTVWLIGGASGAGKTSVAYALARDLGVPIVEVDDIVQALLAMTTPDQQPTLHYWRTHPEAAQLPPPAIVEWLIAEAEALGPAIEAVVANHLETGMSVVIEGDYLVPALAARASFGRESASGRVRAVFLDEPEEDQLVHNFSAREPDQPAQIGRARVSRLHGEWLVAEAVRFDVPVVSARPWTTVITRAREALERGTTSLA